jgi:2-desacetyl-2-hydroxyethyl bacteriochlorophyllide A dehydrogenase
MSTSPLHQRLVFTGKQQVQLESFDLGAPEPGKVRVHIQRSLMSTGTENIVFNRNFDPGTHWDNWVKYPFYPGYASVGTVEALGEEVTTLSVGDRVAVRIKHASHALVAAADCHPIPAGLPWEAAVWFALAKITFHGAHAARYQLGDSVLIIGAGPIGQMSVRWAQAAGATSIIVVDAVPNRMELARQGGATATIVAPIGEAKEVILTAGGGRLPRVVIDSTGHAGVFASALTLADRYGTVIILGDTGHPNQQYLTSDVILRGLTIVGVHDAHNNDQWNNQTITRLFFQLASSGRFPLSDLTSHTFTPAQCAEAYAVANRDRASTMGIIFNWAEPS